MTKTKNKEIELLLANARSLMNKLNKFQEYLDSIDTSILDEPIRSELELRLGNIKPLNDKYEDICIQLQVMSVDSEEIISYDEFYDKYVALTVKSTSLLNSMLQKSVSSDSLILNEQPTSPIRNKGLNAKLPKLSIPVFFGNILEFKSYHEIFTALVHNNPNLTDIERFLHLKTSLKGSASDLISNIQPTGENYHIAFNLLVERFSNPKLIIQNHIKEIFELKPVTKDNSKELRKLYDDLSKHIRALENLSISVNECAVFISHILMTKFDSKTKTEFSKFKPRSVLTLKEINDFLEKQCQLLEEIDSNKATSSYLNNNNFQGNSNKTRTNTFKQSFIVTNKELSCSHCGSNHYITHCPQFLSFSTKQKFDRANELKLCKNCLRHPKEIKCFSKHNCHICHKRHNTLLHFEGNTSNKNITISHKEKDHNAVIDPEVLTQANLSCFQNTIPQVLLSTAICHVRSFNNKWHKARILLDSGSHINFITEDFSNKLNLKRKSFNTQILGINSYSTQSSSIVEIEVSSITSDFKTSLQCVTIPKIAENLPLTSFNRNNLIIPNYIKLADPYFNKSQSIDILIGAGNFYNLMCSGQISLGKNKPILKETLFGWIISGIYQTNCNFESRICANVVLESPSKQQESLENSLQKFWQLENVEPKNPLSLFSPEERFCETHFAKTISRGDTGRFTVSIPFKSNLLDLGSSKEKATERFLYLEKKLQRNSELRNEYSKFIHEYISLGHMSKVNTTSSTAEAVIETFNSKVLLANIPPFYLPHHAVIKADSLTTKLRVVFDGSALSTSNISINDTQIIGPVIQDDLFSILLRFRLHQIALIGDIEKMYRQILINPVERKLQRILWRDEPSMSIDTYELNTITYGTASASYLATKCLQYLSEIYSDIYPKTSRILKTDFYMDDLLTGADTIQETVQIKNELIDILSSSGLHLRKFLSNNPEVLPQESNSNLSFSTIPLGERENAKVLGISWNSVSDVIQYEIKIKLNSTRISKRIIISTVSQLFDPLGLLSPIIIIGKLIIQKLWEFKISWDENIPESLIPNWNHFVLQLTNLSSIKIPRCAIASHVTSIELHGFSDSSITAFGACIYIRCIDNHGNISTKLLCSKSRVAPLRTTTIPRLELSAAVLLAQLMQRVKNSVTINFIRTFYWTDSTIVLDWINSAPNKYKVFVANRIASIQEISESNDWFYIQSEHNPADLISRGSNISNLVNNLLWWQGPCFLKLDSEQWPKHSRLSGNVSSQNKELKLNKSININLLNMQTFDIFGKYSTLTELQRIVAWIHRFSNNSKVSAANRLFGPLQVFELQNSLNCLIRLIQRNSFAQEIKLLKSKQNLKNSSNILSLNPFLDKDDILRIGGRIGNSTYDFDKKFPILLPKNHIFTKLIFKQFHVNLLHCGVLQLLACVREHYWPIAGRSIARGIVHSCVKCFRSNPKSYNPLMGDLPIKRLQANLPVFSYVGIDYAGPILIKDRKLRNSKQIKSYICLFICMVTKAIHLEVVTDLTTDAFIAVLKRFISRRGKPISISSDNATNFVGASNELKNFYQLLNKNNIADYLSQQAIKWEFIIPRAPHRGGLWESAIKCTKSHIKKVLGNTCLNYEDFQTLLCQIEAILNSRPLSPISTDPTDYNPLTPGHFLIGKSLCAIPEKNYIDLSENKLSKYQRMQKIIQHFWKRWSLEVIPELQRRIKWYKNLPNLLKLDSLALIREDNLPPLQWSLGRIMEIHNSTDNIPRSVTLRTANGHYIKRAVNRICILPIE